MLALLTAIGPVRRRISRASSWSGTRSAIVPSVSPRSIRRLGWILQITVSGPGQCFVDQLPGRVGHVGGQRADQAGVGDQHRRRHVPAALLGVEQAAARPRR